MLNKVISIETIEKMKSPFEGSRPLVDALKVLSLYPLGVLARAEANQYSFTEGDLDPVTTITPLIGTANRTPIEGKKVAVLFSGGPAPGGHNVLVGIKQSLGAGNTLMGIKAGPGGLLKGDLFEVSSNQLADVRNLGGFDLLGTDRTKIKTPEQIDQVKKVVQKFGLDGLVIIGGDDSNTNAAILAEALKETSCSVVGVPKTIDGDLQVGELCPISFGFDTATKVYAESVGNLQQDAESSLKYYHFVKLMGRSASHVASEVALQTQPTATLISEEIKEKGQSWQGIVANIADIVESRFQKGINHGVILIPEGLIEAVPDFNQLIQSLNALMPTLDDSFHQKSPEEKRVSIEEILESDDKKSWQALPGHIQDTLLNERDAHGNLQVSLIETEKLLAEAVEQELQKRNPDIPFNTQTHFFGYEGRCAHPSEFDRRYAFHLGQVAGSLALDKQTTGHMAAVSDLGGAGVPCGIPLNALITKEERDGKTVPVIEKALVTLDSAAFRYFSENREAWAASDNFENPGPRQYSEQFGANQLPMTVVLNQGLTKVGFGI